jgi:hypothetical protein
MKNSIQAAKTYIMDHKRETAIGVVLTLIIAGLISLFVYNTMPHVVYKPTNACDMLTPAKAQDLLGEKVISVDTKGATISGDIAISKCSYTDSNENKDLMIVAAVAVRSGINDVGVLKNKKDFAASKANDTVEDIKNLGDSAYFNPLRGQLNILEGRRWIIVSYGLGTSPENNTIDKAVELANIVLNYPQFQLERF